MRDVRYAAPGIVLLGGARRTGTGTGNGAGSGAGIVTGADVGAGAGVGSVEVRRASGGERMASAILPCRDCICRDRSGDEGDRAAAATPAGVAKPPRRTGGRELRVAATALLLEDAGAAAEARGRAEGGGETIAEAAAA
jgi:hypothetical protein